MAFQAGALKMKGRIGDLSFYKTKDGYDIVRQPGGPTKAQIMKEPNFERTRENISEFQRASYAGKDLRLAFAPLIHPKRDGTLPSRLTKVMLQIIKLDHLSDRGKRVVTNIETEVLKSFEFNSKGTVRGSVLTPFETKIDRESGQLTIRTPAFMPKNGLVVPEGTTHFQFKAGAAMVDFSTRKSKLVIDESEVFACRDHCPEVILNCSLPPKSKQPLFLTLGINFYQMVNGTPYFLKGANSGGLCVVEVDGRDA